MAVNSQRQRQKRNRSPNTPSEIIIYISAHGEQHHYPLPPSNANVQMLGFQSAYGQYGMMKNKPLSFSKNSLDELAMRVTVKTLKSSKTDSLQTGFQQALPKELKKIYLASLMTDDEFADFDEGFIITAPARDRTFYMKPNHDESHEFKPHYGIHIIDVQTNNSLFSSFEVEQHKSRHFDHGNITTFSSDDVNHRARINENINTISGAIRQISHPTTKDECIEIYDNMLFKSQVRLSELIFLFHSMGFQHVYFIGPSCRYISEDNPVYMTALARHKRTDSVIVNTPTVDWTKMTNLTPDEPGSLPRSTTDSLSSSIPDSTPDSTPDSSPGSLPGPIPSSLSDSVPGSLPVDSPKPNPWYLSSWFSRRKHAKLDTSMMSSTSRPRTSPPHRPVPKSVTSKRRAKERAKGRSNKSRHKKVPKPQTPF